VLSLEGKVIASVASFLFSILILFLVLSIFKYLVSSY
jgi:hypothetical protein